MAEDDNNVAFDGSRFDELVKFVEFGFGSKVLEIPEVKMEVFARLALLSDANAEEITVLLLVEELSAEQYATSMEKEIFKRNPRSSISCSNSLIS